MRKTIALVRAGFLTAASYRLSIVVSFAMLAFQAVPTFYIGHILQPFMGPSIQSEGKDYFGFLLVGTVAYLFLAAAVDALPRALDSGIYTGTLEALFTTPTPLAVLLAGLTGHEMIMTMLRAGVFLVVGSALGARVAWSHLPAASLIILLIVLAYYPIGVLAGALIVAFRRAGPLQTVVVVFSGLLGGVSYSTTMQQIPSWIQRLSTFVPLTYGLRALRRVLLEGRPLADVASDLSRLAALGLALFILGAYCFSLALRHARRSGSLAQY